MATRRLLADVHPSPTLILGKEMTVLEAAELMTSARTNAGIVQDAKTGALVGILTDSDVSIKVIAGGRGLAATRVGDVMTPRPLCCRTDETATHAPVRIFRSSSTSVRSSLPQAIARRHMTSVVMNTVPDVGEADDPIWRERTAPRVAMRTAMTMKPTSIVKEKPVRPSARKICRPIRPEPVKMARDRNITT